MEYCSVNGLVRQDATLDQLIWSDSEIIAALSSSVPIQPGDLVYTGTPAGVGPLAHGDICTVHIKGPAPVTTVIAPRTS